MKIIISESEFPSFPGDTHLDFHVNSNKKWNQNSIKYDGINKSKLYENNKWRSDLCYQLRKSVKSRRLIFVQRNWNKQKVIETDKSWQAWGKITMTTRWAQFFFCYFSFLRREKKILLAKNSFTSTVNIMINYMRMPRKEDLNT